CASRERFSVVEACMAIRRYTRQMTIGNARTYAIQRTTTASSAKCDNAMSQKTGIAKTASTNTMTDMVISTTEGDVGISPTDGAFESDINSKKREETQARMRTACHFRYSLPYSGFKRSWLQCRKYDVRPLGKGRASPIPKKITA